MPAFTYTIGPDFTVKFPGKPSEDVRRCLKGWGLRWNPASQSWWKRGCRGAADCIAGLRKLLEPKRPDGACWDCQSPEGYFRPYGAATPVYCDSCECKRRAPAVDPMGADLAYEDACARACGL